MSYNIYYKDNCGFCTKAEELLEGLGLNFTSINMMVNLESNKKMFMEEFGVEVKSAPQIVLNIGGGEMYIGGYQDLHRHLMEDKL